VDEDEEQELSRRLRRIDRRIAVVGCLVLGVTGGAIVAFIARDADRGGGVVADRGYRSRGHRRLLHLAVLPRLAIIVCQHDCRVGPETSDNAHFPNLSPGTYLADFRRGELHPLRSHLSFAFPSAIVCHCMLLG
jgi:hypothetical protein